MAGNPLRILAQTVYPRTVASARVRVAEQSPFLAAHAIALDYVQLARAPGARARLAVAWHKLVPPRG